MTGLEILYHSLGFLLLFITLLIAYKFFVNYRYTGEFEMIAAVTMLVAFLMGLIITSINVILGLFNIQLPITDEGFRLLAPIFNIIMVVSWFYVFYQLLYSNSNTVKILFYAIALINLVWIGIYIYLAFFSNLSVATIKLFIDLYDLISMVVTLTTFIILAVKSIKSKDKVLKYRGFFLIVGFVLGFLSLLLDDGIFDPTRALLDLFARGLLIIGIGCIYEGFFLTEDTIIIGTKILFRKTDK